ncbi:MAG: hypothetical protein KDA73_01380 [Rhodobacteraceae bacterium]|nr:hypothetical protein [Paracoccaceae bacterium]
MPLDEAKAFRDAALDAGIALDDGARVFDALVTLLTAEELTPLEIEAIIRLAGRGLRAVSTTSGDTLSTLYDRLRWSVDECEAGIPRIEENERQRTEAMAEEEDDDAA